MKKNWDDYMENISSSDLSYARSRVNLKRLINASFFFWCSVLFSVGIFSGIAIKTPREKFLCAIACYCVTRYYARNKIDGWIVYGGMEAPDAFSFGLSLTFLSFLFLSQETLYLNYAIMCFIPGFYYFYIGYKEGPHYGWACFLERKQNQY